MSLTKAFSNAAALRPSLAPNEYIEMTCEVYIARMHDGDKPGHDSKDKIMVSDKIAFPYAEYTKTLNLVGGGATLLPYTVREFHSFTADNVDGDVPIPGPFNVARKVEITITEDNFSGTKLTARKESAIVSFLINNPDTLVVVDNENQPTQIKMLELRNFTVRKARNPPLPN